MPQAVWGPVSSCWCRLQEPLSYVQQRPQIATDRDAALGLAMHLLPAAPMFWSQWPAQTCKMMLLAWL